MTEKDIGGAPALNLKADEAAPSMPPDAARIAMEFLDRVTLTGREVNAFLFVRKSLEAIAQKG